MHQDVQGLGAEEGLAAIEVALIQLVGVPAVLYLEVLVALVEKERGCPISKICVIRSLFIKFPVYLFVFCCFSHKFAASK